jgi:single-strand DNA-binding protein
VTLDGIQAALVGRVGSDAVLRFTQAGTPMVRVAVAVSDSHAGTQWLSIVRFGNGAEDLVERLRKGTLVIAEGKLRLASWTASDGAEHHGLNLYATRLEAFPTSGSTSSTSRSTSSTSWLHATGRLRT